MHDSETEETLAALRAIRRQLTVVFLAVEQVCRKTASLPPVQRLCSFATDALGRVKDEVAGIEARLLRRERSEERRSDHSPEHPPSP